MDHQFRALERQAAQGDLEAQGQLLLLRVRAGDLSRERLDLAVHLHHPPALRALGRADADAGSTLPAWVIELERWGRPVLVRALVAAAKLLDAHVDDDTRRQQLAAAESWCDCPCRSHALEAYGASRATDGVEPSPSYHAAFAAHVAGNMEGASGRSSLLRVAKIALHDAHLSGREPELRDVIRSALVPWACGAA